MVQVKSSSLFARKFQIFICFSFWFIEKIHFILTNLSFGFNFEFNVCTYWHICNVQTCVLSGFILFNDSPYGRMHKNEFLRHFNVRPLSSIQSKPFLIHSSLFIISATRHFPPRLHHDILSPPRENSPLSEFPTTTFPPSLLF